MKKIKKHIKRNIKVVIAFLLGGIIIGTGGVYAATVLSSSNVSYDNSDSGLNSTTVKEAIDELVDKTDIRKSPNIVSAYTYNQTSGASNYCVFGYEETCEKTDCYKSTTATSCPIGTIIVYKVNPRQIRTFNVLFDKGATMIMQDTNSIKTVWNSSDTNTEGLLTALENLELVTSSWSNVNSQTYTMGQTIFKTNPYTGCTTSSCTTSVYTLSKTGVKARFITAQEAMALGCSSSSGSCPAFFGNVYGMWTMSAYSSNSTNAIYICNSCGPYSRILSHNSVTTVGGWNGYKSSS